MPTNKTTNHLNSGTKCYGTSPKRWMFPQDMDTLCFLTLGVQFNCESRKGRLFDALEHHHHVTKQLKHLEFFNEPWLPYSYVKLLEVFVKASS